MHRPQLRNFLVISTLSIHIEKYVNITTGEITTGKRDILSIINDLICEERWKLKRQQTADSSR